MGGHEACSSPRCAPPPPPPPRRRARGGGAAAVAPFLLYLADGDVAPGSFNVFSENLKDVQKIFRRRRRRPPARPFACAARAPASPADRRARRPPRRYPETDCSLPASVGGADAGQPGAVVSLVLVLQRCPHYTTAIGPKWGAPGEPSVCCAVL